MSLIIKFDQEQSVVTLRVVGQMTAVELMEAYAELFEDERFTANMHAIWDINSIDLVRVPVSEFRTLSLLMSNIMARRGSGFRVALVTHRSTDFHLLKIYVGLLKLIGTFQLKLFRQIESAHVWVNQPR